MEYRRQAPRRSVEWRGAVLIEDELATVGWRECVVLDVSTNGLGIAFHDHRRSELIGRSVSIEFPLSSDSVSIRLEGTIRHARPVAVALVRVGIEFDRLPPAERAITAALSALTDADAPDALHHLSI